MQETIKELKIEIMEEKLKELKLVMEEEETIRELMVIKRKEFEEENKDTLERLIKVKETIASCKEIITGEAEIGFKADGLKKRLGGIGIREYVVLDYDDKQALSWAMEKDMFLQLDKKAFDKVAKTGEIDFVEINKKVTVTFPKKIELGDE